VASARQRACILSSGIPSTSHGAKALVCITSMAENISIGAASRSSCSFGIHFGLEQPVTNYRRAATQDRQALLQFIVGCVKRGLYVHVSPHRSFSAVHTQADLDRALNAIKGALSNLRRTWLA